jgi:N-acetylglucosaminyl-diphospho-decaprenol L-rhamnosyltransferase
MIDDFAVYIPNLNGGRRLLEVLDALAEQTVVARTVVVDNASTDGSAEAALARHPGTVLVGLDRNLGFGRALEAGVRAWPAKRLVFVNNDVVCEPRFLEAMLDDAGTDQAMVAGILLQHAAPQLIDSAGVAADQTLLAWDYLYGQPVEAAIDAPPPLGPTGGAALYDLASFETVGGFDKRIFAYLEDLDLALRLRLAGVPCRLSVDARANHRHSSTLGSGSSAKNRLMGWSRGYMMRRYGILREPRLAARALFVEGVIGVGQVCIDRNASGISGRIDGWRAARGLPRLAFPRHELLQLSTTEALRKRASRRAGGPRSA